MLHRSFKAGKCKTSLKLAVSRIKLMKNKSDTKLRQMKRDLAQLLEAGQEQTALIRVEHIVREEKIIAAYDLIDVYCGLIVARLPIIESQKNCPIDLKEAVCSIIFASPRCEDVPELRDIRKHFTAKYGKEFITSALELRPECGVSRTMVEKLSAKAPDGETKIKILTAIAQEHNIKWDPKSFGEKNSKPHEDLLNGPNTFETAKPAYVHNPPTVVQLHESYNVPRSSPTTHTFASPNAGSPNVTMPASSYPEPRAPESGTKGREFEHPFSKDENAFSLNRQNWNMEFKDATAAAQAAAESAERASRAARAAAELSSRDKIARQYSTESHESSFYDVIDGGSRKSTGPIQEPVVVNSVPMAHDSTKSPSYGANPSMHNQKRDWDEQDNLQGDTESRYGGHGSIGRRSSQSVSSESPVASTHDDILVNNFQKEDRYSQKSSSEVDTISSNWETEKPGSGDFLGKASIKKQSSKSESVTLGSQKTERTDQPGEGKMKKEYSRSSSSHTRASVHDDDGILNSHLQKYVNNADHFFISADEGNMKSGTEQLSSSESESLNLESQKTERTDQPGERKMKKEYSRSSSSHSRASDHDDNGILNSHLQKHVNNAEHFSISAEEGNMKSGTEQLSSNYFPTSVFDESGSDDDYNMDVEGGYNGHESNLYFQSPSLFANTDIWSPRKNTSESLEKPSAQSHFDEELLFPSEVSEGLTKSVVPPQLDDLVHATFDESDGNSESEEERNDSKLGRSAESSSQPHKQNVVARSPGSTHTDTGHQSTGSSDMDSEDAHSERNQETKLNLGVKSWKKNGLGDSPASPSTRPRRSPLNLDDLHSKPFFSPVIEEKQRPLLSSRISLAREGTHMDNLGVPGSPDSMKLSGFSDSSSSESERDLNFGKLTGGLRNKGYRHPPYTRDHSSDASRLSRKQAAENTPIIERMTVSPVITTTTYSEARSQESNNQKPRIEVPKESKFGPPKTFFYSDSDDEEEILPRQTGGRKDYTGSKLSWRTKRNSTESETGVSRSIFGSEVSVKSDFGTSGKPSGSSLATEPLSQPQPQMVSLGNVENSKSLRTNNVSARQPSKPMPKSEPSESKGSFKSSGPVSTAEQPSISLPKNVPPRSTGSTEKSSLSGGSASTGNSLKKVGHVHLKANSGDGENFNSLKTNNVSARQPSKPMPKSESSEGKGSSKFSEPNSIVQQPSHIPPKNVPLGSTGSPEKSSLSGGSTSRENSLKTAGNVHPKVNSGDGENFNSSRTNDVSARQPSKPIPKSESSEIKGSFKSSEPYSKAEQSSNTLPKTVSSGSTESSEKSSLSGGSTSRENSLKKAGHVHPKLPEYDTFAAHFQSLRSNRR